MSRGGERVRTRHDRARARQDRILGAGCPMPRRAKDLVNQLRNTLQVAWAAGYLRTPAGQVSKLLQTKSGASRDGCSAVKTHLNSDVDEGDIPSTHLIVGGDKKVEERQFRRRDDALLNFFVIVQERKNEDLMLLVYHFHLQLPPGWGPEFIRYDLQRPGADKGKQGMRCHLHPGHRDLHVPSPLLSPVELLEFLLYEADLERG